MQKFKQTIFQRKNSTKEIYTIQRKYTQKKNTLFQHKVLQPKVLQPKKIHFCEMQISTKFINFVPAIYFQK